MFQEVDVEFVTLKNTEKEMMIKQKMIKNKTQDAILLF